MNATNYGFSHFWAQGDAITHFIAIVLLIMSVVSWTVMIFKSWRLWTTRRQANIASNQFWHSKNLAEGVALLGNTSEANPFRELAQDGLNAVQHHETSRDDLHGALNVSEWLSSCLRRRLRQVNFDCVLQNRHGDNKDNQQHQHHINERRHVDFAHQLFAVI